MCFKLHLPSFYHSLLGFLFLIFIVHFIPSYFICPVHTRIVGKLPPCNDLSILVIYIIIDAHNGCWMGCVNRMIVPKKTIFLSALGRDSNMRYPKRSNNFQRALGVFA